MYIDLWLYFIVKKKRRKKCAHIQYPHRSLHRYKTTRALINAIRSHAERQFVRIVYTIRYKK